MEQPDHFGRTFVMALGLWTGVGLVVYLGLVLAVPHRPLATPTSVPASSCKSTLDSAIGDPAASVVAGPSRCGGTSASAGDPGPTLRAWLEGAEIIVTHAAAPPVDAALRARGAELYARHCAGCHGPTGGGSGVDACVLATRPAIHSAGVYELRTTEHEALPTDDDLFRTITRGVHGTAMPPWFALDERDRWALVAHVKSLSKQFTEDVAPPPIDSGEPPAETPERLAHGHTLYLERGCASCHGDDGRGHGVAAAALPNKPRDFTRGRFHRGTSAADIHETIVTGLDGTPMASFVKVMAPDELWDVSLYVHGLTPPLVTRDGMRCPETTGGLVHDELLGVRAVMRTLQLDAKR